jgi:formylglycine-generating enzyme required for sulfatase activity
MFSLVKLFFIIFLIALPSHYSFSSNLRGVSPIPVIDAEDNQIILYKESHALIVGVSKYTYDWPQLSGVKKDIKLVDLVLKESGFNTVILNNPSYEYLKKEIESFISMYGQDVDNRLLFYFAGHGHTLKLSFGEDMGYFVPTDAPHPNQDKNGFLSKGFNMELMQVYAKQIQSKHALFLFDSCFSGYFFSKTRSVPSNISYKTSQPVRQFITSGSANELVPDQSIFREQFIYALKGEGDLDSDGYLTGTELGEFIQKNVINYSNGSQHPQYGKMRNPRLDKGDFVFPLRTPVRTSELDNNVKKEERRLTSAKTKLQIKKKQLEETRQLVRERKIIEKEHDKLNRERLRIASKIRQKTSSAIKRSQYCPENMVTVNGRNFIASRDGNVPYEVTVKTICVDIFEVTQNKYQSIMGDNPSHFKGVPSRPVENVTWLQAKIFCQKKGKRLPTEWEWENATGSQNSDIYYWGNKFNAEFAWFNGNSSSRTNPVGQKKANSIGLYDMVGNVWEWTDSGEDNIKFLRGGSWNSFASGMAISERRRSDPSFKSSTYGFRCVQ